MSARITEAMDILAGMKADLDLLQLAVKAEDPYSELRIRVADLRAATHTLRLSWLCGEDGGEGCLDAVIEAVETGQTRKV